MLEGGDDASRAAGVVFAATMLVRVPVYLFQGLAASLLPNLTRMQATVGNADLRRAVSRTVVLLLSVGVVTVLAGATIGPAVMQLLFGADFQADHGELALLGAGVGCYLAAATISQALLALDCGARAAVVWVSSAALFVALFLGLPGTELGRVAGAFAVATFVGLIGLGAVLWRLLATR